MLHNAVTVAFPFPVVLAEVAVQTTPFSWTQALLVYGPLGLWVSWFVIRDKLDRDERKQERIDNERRHTENISQQKKIEQAFRTTTTSVIVTMSAIKHMDNSYRELYERIKEENHPEQ